MITSVSLESLRPCLLAVPGPFVQRDGAARGRAFLAPDPRGEAPTHGTRGPKFDAIHPL